MASEISPEWFSLALAAKYTDTSAKTVSRWLKAGELKYTRLPSGTVRIRRADLDDFMERHAVSSVELRKTVDELLRGLL